MIPASFNNYPVTRIGDGAFEYCRSLTSIEIPDSVITIGNHAFEYCDSLISIEIPDSVITIGEYAFFYCYSLISIEIPDSVTSIGADAFYACELLATVTIPDSVITIGESVFEWCSSLTSVTIPDSVITIGENAFASCRSLTSVTIPDSVTTIGHSAFRECSYDIILITTEKSPFVYVIAGLNEYKNISNSIFEDDLVWTDGKFTSGYYDDLYAGTEAEIVTMLADYIAKNQPDSFDEEIYDMFNGFKHQRYKGFGDGYNWNIEDYGDGTYDVELSVHGGSGAWNFFYCSLVENGENFEINDIEW